MSDFVQTMKDWRRMCDAYTTDDAARCCQGCPMDGRGCGAIYEGGNADPEVIEREVNQWAAEHPEPVYPTWEKYLADLMMLDMMCDKTDNPNSVENYMRKTPIPADIAEKLGIGPKEG
jgi:hypothetical protein